jgi:hypothetical protein
MDKQGDDVLDTSVWTFMRFSTCILLQITPTCRYLMCTNGGNTVIDMNVLIWNQCFVLVGLEVATRLLLLPE